ncbi:hypothetical protein [Ruegeria atlantica]|nr:hypothetical protein [Ruegeria atlantica]
MDRIILVIMLKWRATIRWLMPRKLLRIVATPLAAWGQHPVLVI